MCSLADKALLSGNAGVERLAAYEGAAAIFRLHNRSRGDVISDRAVLIIGDHLICAVEERETVEAMRISYVINSLDGGGAALPLVDVIGVMREAGHDVSVISLMERDGRARSQLDQVGIPCKVIGGSRRSFFGTTLRFQRLLLADRPDLIWTSLSHAAILGQVLGRLNGIRVVSWLHNAYLKPANKAILRRTKGLARRWVSDSSEVVDFGVSELGIDRRVIDVWPLFIADPASPVASPWQPSQPFRIGSLGRLHPNKGYDVLIRAVAMLNRRDGRNAARLQVTIGGEGGEQKRLRSLARELQAPNVEFVGFQAQPKDFLAGLHAYVQPSHHEGLCIAGHEAMQAGLPVVASRVGELQRSIAASKSGALVDYGDETALADALQSFVENPARAAACGSAARAWVLERYSRSRFRQSGLAALRKVQLA